MPTYTPLPPASFRMPLCPFDPYKRPFNFYTQPNPAYVMKKDGHYIRVYAPAWEILDELVEGTEFFSEGRTYTIDTQTAADLVADGFGEHIT